MCICYLHPLLLVPFYLNCQNSVGDTWITVLISLDYRPQARCQNGRYLRATPLPTKNHILYSVFTKQILNLLPNRASATFQMEFPGLHVVSQFENAIYKEMECGALVYTYSDNEAIGKATNHFNIPVLALQYMPYTSGSQTVFYTT